MRYESPVTTDAAVALLAGETGVARAMAGGTDLLVQLRSGSLEPDLIVDLKRIEVMNAITEEEGGLRVGAAVPSAVLSEHPAAAGWPGVVEAAGLIGSTQIQGRATLAGNLCNASPAADAVPALVASGAMAAVVGPGGRREIRVQDIVTGPRSTSLAKGEVVESILLPARPRQTGDAYLRFIPRTEMDIAVAGAAVYLTLNAEDVCIVARVALGAVAARALLVEEAANVLIGTHVDDNALESLARAASAACRPIDDKRGTKEYRIKVAGVLAKRAARIALERARANR